VKLNLQTLTFAVLVIVLPVQGWLCTQMQAVKVSVARLEALLTTTADRLARNGDERSNTLSALLFIYEHKKNPKLTRIDP
jgi:uncharacterized membrane protein YccC